MRVEQEDLDRQPSGVEVRPGDKCFYCGETIESVPYVIWQGNSAPSVHDDPPQIGLHIACAEKLADHLKDDAKDRH